MGKFREKDLVWAKMKGYPAWPAKVARPPKGEKPPSNKLYIFFYGTHEHAWLSPGDLLPYEEHKTRFRVEKRIKGWAEALWEVEEDPSLAISSSVHLPPRRRGRKRASESGMETVPSETPSKPKRRRAGRRSKEGEVEEGGGGSQDVLESSQDSQPLSQEVEPPASQSTEVTHHTSESAEERVTQPSESKQHVTQPSESKECDTQPSQSKERVTQPSESEERVTQHGMKMRSRRAITSPQRFVATLSSPTSPLKPLKHRADLSQGHTSTGEEGVMEEVGGGGEREELHLSPPTQSNDKGVEEKGGGGVEERGGGSMEQPADSQSQDTAESSQGSPTRRYSTRKRRHPSGSSSIVEQLTQSYGERKESLGSPQTARGLRGRLGSGEEKRATGNGPHSRPEGGMGQRRSKGRRGRLSENKDSVSVEESSSEKGQPKTTEGDADSTVEIKSEITSEITSEVKSEIKPEITSGIEPNGAPLAGPSQVQQPPTSESSATEGSKVTSASDKDPPDLSHAPPVQSLETELSDKPPEAQETDLGATPTSQDPMQQDSAPEMAVVAPPTSDAGEKMEDSSREHPAAGKEAEGEGGGSENGEAGGKKKGGGGSENGEAGGEKKGGGGGGSEDGEAGGEKKGEGGSGSENGEAGGEKKGEGGGGSENGEAGGEKKGEGGGKMETEGPLAKKGEGSTASGESTEKELLPDPPPIVQVQPGMTPVQVLQTYNYNLKAALTLHSPNVQQALATLKDLLELKCTASQLEQVPDLVQTLRKLRRYRPSERVQKRAEEVYCKLKGLFLHPKHSARQQGVAMGVRRRPMMVGIRGRGRGRGRGMVSMVPRKPTPQQVKQWNTPTVPESTEKERMKEEEEGKAKVQETRAEVCVKKEEEKKEEEGEAKVLETTDEVHVKKEEEEGETKAQKAGSKTQVGEESEHLANSSSLTRRPLRRSGRGERVDYSKMMESAAESESGEDTQDQTVPS